MKKQNLLFLIPCAFIIYVGLKIFSALKDANQEQLREGIFMPEKTGDYKFLFSKTKSDAIEPDFARFSRVSFPISTFNYTKGYDSYKIIIYKFVTKDANKLLSSINLTDQNTSINGKTYKLIKLTEDIDANSSFDSKIQRIHHISIALNGNYIRNTIKTDSLLGYNVQINNMGIKFNNNTDPNICFFSNHLFKKVPIQILFYRKTNFLYLLLLTSANAKDIANANLLLNLIDKK
ncbi:hypothetical protein [Pedobacter sp. CFBP9032]|uniref:hypothetical protein n=1 Tax=Pedobacter sp. CFBP9032 TaxID=3096539 RepID=UPI002A6ACDEC|nr:hypothetical protein [Pedobacter sp. CFBP9032]MDY0904263.1 hypothetical protein [Pedobacter sp. CFBP9032]